MRPLLVTMQSIRHNYLRIVLLHIFLVSVCSLTVTLGHSYQEKDERPNTPINKCSLLIALLRGELKQKELIEEVKRTGVDFNVTSDDEKELRKAGASKALIDAVRNNYRPQQPKGPQQPKETSDALCRNVKSIAVFYNSEEIGKDKNSKNTAEAITSKLKENKDCPVTASSPAVRTTVTVRLPPVHPNDPPIEIRYFLASDKGYAQAIAAYIKKETGIDLNVPTRPNTIPEPEKHQGKFDIVLMKKVF